MKDKMPFEPEDRANMTGTSIIRDYDSSVFSQLYRLLSDVYASSVSQEELETHYLGPDQQIILALSDETVVGCAFLSYNTDFIRKRKIVFVSYVAVDKVCRHQGIGSMLFAEIEKRAKSRGCSAIELTSADSRTSAHAFYHALNYTKKKTTVFIKEME